MEICVEEIFDELKNSVELLKEIVERLNHRQSQKNTNINDIVYISNHPNLDDLNKIDMKSIHNLLKELSYYSKYLEQLTLTDN